MYFYMLNIAEAFQKEIDKIFSQNNIQSFVYYVMYCLQNILNFSKLNLLAMGIVHHYLLSLPFALKPLYKLHTT